MGSMCGKTAVGYSNRLLRARSLVLVFLFEFFSDMLLSYVIYRWVSDLSLDLFCTSRACSLAPSDSPSPTQWILHLC